MKEDIPVGWKNVVAEHVEKVPKYELIGTSVPENDTSFVLTVSHAVLSIHYLPVAASCVDQAHAHNCGKVVHRGHSVLLHS